MIYSFRRRPLIRPRLIPAGALALALFLIGCEVDVSYEYTDNNGKTVRKSYSNTDSHTDSSDRRSTSDRDDRSPGAQAPAEAQEYNNGYYSVRYPPGWEKVEDPNLDDVHPLNEAQQVYQSMRPDDAVVIYNTRNDRQYVKLQFSRLNSTDTQRRNFNMLLHNDIHNVGYGFKEEMRHRYGITTYSENKSTEQFKTYLCHHLRVTGTKDNRTMTAHYMAIPNGSKDMMLSIIYLDSHEYDEQAKQVRNNIIDSIELYF